MNLCSFWGCKRVATHKVITQSYDPPISGQYCETCAKELNKKARDYKVEKL